MEGVHEHPHPAPTCFVASCDPTYPAPTVPVTSITRRILTAVLDPPSAPNVEPSPPMSTSELAVIASPSPKAVRFAAERARCPSSPSNGYLLVGVRLEARVPLRPACDGR
jgi:hypothetical protein